MTSDTDLVAMPKAGQVDLGDGDRIASPTSPQRSG
jgi:hypothetical protein